MRIESGARCAAGFRSGLYRLGVNSRLQTVIKPCPFPPQSRHREFATTCLLRAKRRHMATAKKHPLFDHAISDLEAAWGGTSDPAPWGKDAPLGRDIERFVTIVITPILSGRHRCYARI